MTEVKPLVVVRLALFRSAFPPRLEDNLGSFCRNALLLKGFPDNSVHTIRFSYPSWDVVDSACLEDAMSLLSRVTVWACRTKRLCCLHWCMSELIMLKLVGADETIGDFRVHPNLHFKSRLSAKSLLWKSVFIHIEIETNYHNKNFALRLALKVRRRGTRKWLILIWLDRRGVISRKVIR